MTFSDWRLRSLVIAVLCAWAVLAGRLLHVQWWDREEFAALANRQRTTTETLPARPGEILDRRGRLLATTITAQSLFVDPSAVDDPQQMAQLLGQTLDIDVFELAQRFAEDRDKKFLWIKRRMTDEQAERVLELGLPESVWGLQPEYLRRYPQGRLAAHALGVRDIDGIGRGGVEEACDEVLRGTDGRRVLVRDARGRVIAVDEADSAPPIAGQTLVLTLDAVIQQYAERELESCVEQWRPLSACVVVMDPQNGDVLAIASRPAFDPNDPKPADSRAWTNTAIASMYEPGSTFKPFVAGWAIEQGVVERHERLDCENGAYRMGRRLLRDEHAHGLLSLADVLVYSSNIGMAKLGERLTNAGLYQATLAFGFGRRTGIRLPGELSGLVRPLSEWNHYSIGSIPMGQELAATPMQLITAYAALANGGRLLSPRLLLRVTDAIPLRIEPEQTSEPAPTVVGHAVQADVARWLVTEPLSDVVRRGTGRRAQLDGYTVFGKTGTAQKVDPATGRYASDKHVCSFVCGAPSEDPRVLVLVLVDEPTTGGEHFGGTVAAPTAARVLEQTLTYLRVPPGGTDRHATRR